MKTLNPALPIMAEGQGVWEDLVSDYLELATPLSEKDRESLLEVLRGRRLSAEAIETHPSFSLAGCVIVVCHGIRPRECWLYFPEDKRLIRYRVAKRNGKRR